MRSLSLLTCLLLASGCDCAGAPIVRDGGSLPDAGRPDAGPPPTDGGIADECYNGLDDDGDGRVDEDCACVPGEGQRCFSGTPALAGIGGCVWGMQRCVSDFEFSGWDVCIGDGEPVEEVCDGVDNDCDGVVDEGCLCLTGEPRSCYYGPDGTEGVGRCRAGSQECLATITGSDWGSCDGAIVPTDEICDGGGDEDCDGLIDEGCTCRPGATQPCYGGTTETRAVGECSDGIQDCVAGTGGVLGWGACTGEVRPRGEACSGGRDEDCDGLTDCADPDCRMACCTTYGETLAVVPAEGEILFVVDRSGSMDWPAVGTTRTRWEELLGAMTATLPMLSGLHMGLLTFPLQTGSSETRNCAVAATPDIPIGLGTGAMINARLLAADPWAGDTPTPDAFATAEAYFRATPTARERYLILATDGLPEPNCGATVPATVTAIAGLRSREMVDTFVLGIVGPDASGDTSGIPALQAGLNMMADAGGRARGGMTRYYEAVDGAAMSAAIRAIVASATNCRFSLRSAPPRPSRIVVRQDGITIPASGYALSGTDLEFTGSYCARIQAGLVSSITVTDDCTVP